jgi:hypothetical protein
MPNPKELTEDQIRILENICEDGTLETLAVVEAGFASWGHANHLGKEVVRLAQMVNALSKHIRQDSNDDSPTEHDSPVRLEQVNELPSDEY